jgi:hypothetical protein
MKHFIGGIPNAGARGVFFLIYLFAFTACAGSLLLEHRVAYSNRGTQEEVRHGFLLLDGSLVPDVFIFVQQDGAAWTFYQRARAFGQDGYHIALRSSNIRPSDMTISDKALKRGWYTHETILSNTPPGWLYVLWSACGEGTTTTAAFVSPRALFRFIKEYGLAPLPRAPLLPMPE